MRLLKIGLPLAFLASVAFSSCETTNEALKPVADTTAPTPINPLLDLISAKKDKNGNITKPSLTISRTANVSFAADGSVTVSTSLSNEVDSLLAVGYQFDINYMQQGVGTNVPTATSVFVLDTAISDHDEVTRAWFWRNVQPLKIANSISKKVDFLMPGRNYYVRPLFIKYYGKGYDLDKADSVTGGIIVWGECTRFKAPESANFPVAYRGGPNRNVKFEETFNATPADGWDSTSARGRIFNDQGFNLESPELGVAISSKKTLDFDYAEKDYQIEYVVRQTNPESGKFDFHFDFASEIPRVRGKAKRCRVSIRPSKQTYTLATYQEILENQNISRQELLVDFFNFSGTLNVGDGAINKAGENKITIRKYKNFIYLFINERIALIKPTRMIPYKFLAYGFTNDYFFEENRYWFNNPFAYGKQFSFTAENGSKFVVKSLKVEEITN